MESEVLTEATRAGFNSGTLVEIRCKSIDICNTNKKWGSNELCSYLVAISLSQVIIFEIEVAEKLRGNYSVQVEQLLRDPPCLQ